MMTTYTTAKQEQLSVPSLSTTAVVISILGLLTFMGAIAGIGRLILGMGSTTGLSDPVSWGIWIGFDFVLIAFSGAGFTMAAVGHVFHLEKYHAAVRPAILTGLLGYVSVLLLLVLDLGRPDRFYSFLINWNIHSPLFEVSCCIMAYSTVLFIESSSFVLERFHWEKPLRWLNKAMLPVAITGVTLSSLHQSTLGTLYLNMPHRLDELWYTPVLPPLFFISSVMAGLSVAMIAYAVAMKVGGRQVKAEVLNGLAKGVGWITLLYVLFKLGEIAVSGELPALFSFDSMSQLMWLELGLGAIVPMILMLLPSVRAHPIARWIGPALILFGVLANRFNATLFAQTPPAGMVPYTPHILEWLSTIGILTGIAIAWYLGIRYLSVLESETHH
jgi:Ni/Fe-hydrogenase subunit HybB-like protein